MAYNNAIPTSSQRLRDSQPQILENFATISALIGVDHIITPWTNPASGDQGKHNRVVLPEQAGDPVTAANEMAIYTKAVTGVTQLFIANEGAGDVVDITSAVKATTGETTLPSGIKLKWGRGVTGATGAGLLTFTFAGLALTNFTTIYSVQATCATTVAPGHNEDQVVARIDAYSTTGMTIQTLRIQALGGAPFNANFNWFAIGV